MLYDLLQPPPFPTLTVSNAESDALRKGPDGCCMVCCSQKAFADQEELAELLTRRKWATAKTYR